jgi:hypothetical protein
MRHCYKCKKMADTPSFVFTILNKELYDIQKKLLESVAKDHNLDADNLVATYLKDPLATNIVPNTKTKIEVVRRAVVKTPPKAEERCMARVWNRGKGGQCTRRRVEDDLCTAHAQCGTRNGRIDKPPPEHIFGKIKVVYK